MKDTVRSPLRGTRSLFVLIAGIFFSGAVLSSTPLSIEAMAGAAPVPARMNAAMANGFQTAADCTPALPLGDVFAINAGGPAVACYSADSNFTGGNVYSNTSQPITFGGASNAPAPAQVYQDEREGRQFSYIFTGLQPGITYAEILHFAELYWSLPEQRQFNVAINGTQVLQNFDVVATAGAPFRAVDEFFFVRADANGTIEIDFSSGAVDQPLISAIEIRADTD
jgi:Malectin domain